MAQIAQNRTQKEVVQAIATTSLISTQRSYADFMLAAKRIIPDFFGFEGVGILFRDSVKNTLFSVEEQEIEEDR